MKKNIVRIIFLFVIQFIIAVAHLTLIDILPYPFNLINLGLIFLILYNAIVIRPQLLWSVMPLIWFLELFSSLPFGVNAAAIIISLIIFNLVLLTVFSNRSIPTIIFSSVFVIVFYRILILLFLEIINFFVITNKVVLNSEWFKNLSWELLFTTLITVLVYFILSLFLKRLRPEYITAAQKEYDSKRYFR